MNLVQIDCGLSVTDNIICLYAWFIDLQSKLLIDLLSSLVNDLLKLSERYRIGRLFWPILSTIGLSDFHTIVLTLSMIIECSSYKLRAATQWTAQKAAVLVCRNIKNNQIFSDPRTKYTGLKKYTNNQQLIYGTRLIQVYTHTQIKKENLRTGENYINKATLMHRCNLTRDEQRTSLKYTSIYTATDQVYQYLLAIINRLQSALTVQYLTIGLTNCSLLQ